MTSKKIIKDFSNRKTKIGETEVIADSLNPKWVKSMDVDYFFEAQQNFRLEIYDADDINNDEEENIENDDI